MENFETQETMSEMNPQPEKKPKKPRPYVKFVAFGLACSLVGGAIGGGLVHYVGGSANGGSNAYVGSRPNSTINVNEVNTEEQMTAAEIYAKYVNSTVGITTESSVNYFGYRTTTAASGSGFIYTDDGYIVTNYHVVENANSITVTTYDGTTYDATMVGYDEDNDLAVLKIDATGLTPVVIGDSSNMNVGDPVVAIGNPLGELTFSLTSGSISALHRNITLEDNITMELIQTDCAINSGNSGGALFNMYGEVIGITNAKYSSSTSSGASIDNIAFAIPISDVKDTIDGIIEDGTVRSGYIGVSVVDGTSVNLSSGAVVASVTENGPAEQAGLQINDCITAVNGEAVSGSSDLRRIIRNAEIGSTLNLTVTRGTQTLELQVTVEEQVTDALEGIQNTNESTNNRSFFN